MVLRSTQSILHPFKLSRFYCIVCSKQQAWVFSSRLQARTMTQKRCFPFSVHGKKWTAFCFPLDFAWYYSMSKRKWKWVWFAGSGLEAIKEEKNSKGVKTFYITLHTTQYLTQVLKLSSVCKIKEIQFYPQWVLQTIFYLSPSLTHTLTHSRTHKNTYKRYAPPDSNYCAADVGLRGEQLMHTCMFIHPDTIKDCQIRI